MPEQDAPGTEDLWPPQAWLRGILFVVAGLPGLLAFLYGAAMLTFGLLTQKPLEPVQWPYLPLTVGATVLGGGFLLLGVGRICQPLYLLVFVVFVGMIPALAFLERIVGLSLAGSKGEFAILITAVFSYLTYRLIQRHYRGARGRHAGASDAGEQEKD